MALLLQELPLQGDWLDLGCGSGAVAAAWAETPARSGSYLGVDFSPVLLEEARRLAEGKTSSPLRVRFMTADLAAVDWWCLLVGQRFDVISAFAVLHHIPGDDLRKQILAKAHRHLQPGGAFVFSVWQLQHSPRLMARLQPWQAAGLTEDQVDAGDVLMDWRFTLPGEPEQVGLRYVHIFNHQELQNLAEASGFVIEREFESDGKEGRLGLYQVWAKTVG